MPSVCAGLSLTELASVDLGQIDFSALYTEMQPLDLAEGRQVPVAVLSMGNPHAVQVVADVDAAPVETQGPLIEAHPRFPRLAVKFRKSKLKGASHAVGTLQPGAEFAEKIAHQRQRMAWRQHPQSAKSSPGADPCHKFLQRPHSRCFPTQSRRVMF